MRRKPPTEHWCPHCGACFDWFGVLRDHAWAAHGRLLGSTFEDPKKKQIGGNR